MARRDVTDKVRMVGAGVILAGGATLAIVRIVQTIGWSTQLGAMAALILAVGVASVLIGPPPPEQTVNEELDESLSSGWATTAGQGSEGQRGKYGLPLALSPGDAGQMTALGNLVRQGAQPPPHHVERAVNIVAKMATATSSVHDAALRDALLTHAEELGQLLGTLSGTHVPELPESVQVEAAQSFSNAAGVIRQAVPRREAPESHRQTVS